jgi:hypothetical protein
MQVPELKAAGVDKVVCVTVGEPEQVQKWAAENGFDKDTVSDRKGGRVGWWHVDGHLREPPVPTTKPRIMVRPCMDTS